jgi:hypothetical protein
MSVWMRVLVAVAFVNLNGYALGLNPFVLAALSGVAGVLAYAIRF